MISARRPLHDLAPKDGTLERAILDLIEDAGDAGLWFAELPFALGVSPATLENAIRNLQTGLYVSESDAERDFDA
ncbi:MAG: hypothetical protein V7642_1772 [Burkholderiales bacterium]|jgi:hypothetical protein